MIFVWNSVIYARVNVARLLENVTKTQAKRECLCALFKSETTSQEDG